MDTRHAGYTDPGGSLPPMGSRPSGPGVRPGAPMGARPAGGPGGFRPGVSRPGAPPAPPPPPGTLPGGALGRRKTTRPEGQDLSPQKKTTGKRGKSERPAER